MAAARQKEMNDSMTVVATKTRTAGRLVSIEVLTFQVKMAYAIQFDDSTAIDDYG